MSIGTGFRCPDWPNCDHTKPDEFRQNPAEVEQGGECTICGEYSELIECHVCGRPCCFNCYGVDGDPCNACQSANG